MDVDKRIGQPIADKNELGTRLADQSAVGGVGGDQSAHVLDKSALYRLVWLE